MNKKIGFVVLGIIVLVGVFYVGVSYGKSQTSTGAMGATAYSGTRTRGAGIFGGATVGQIIAKDTTSITVQLMNLGAATTATTPAGSKIVFLDSNTKITKQASGTLTDLAVGTNVSVTGTANTDGSVSATAVQIRPATARPAQ